MVFLTGILDAHLGMRIRPALTYAAQRADKEMPIRFAGVEVEEDATSMIDPAARLALNSWIVE
jgi:hypothetical protein